MTMGISSIRDAISAHIATNWTHTPIQEENDAARISASASAYLQIEYPIAGRFLRSFGAPGANYVPVEGVLRIALFIRAGAGSKVFAGRLETLLETFRGQTIGGVAFDPDYTGPNAAPSIDGKWFPMTAAIAWTAAAAG